MTLNTGDWNSTFLDEMFQFPSKLTHDDTIDALAYIDQLAETVYPGTFLEIDDWNPFDATTGY
jgi:hypothetical protein